MAQIGASNAKETMNERLYDAPICPKKTIVYEEENYVRQLFEDIDCELLTVAISSK
jgi:hypothetical protein